MIRSGEHMIFTARLLQIEFATTVRSADWMREMEVPLLRAVDKASEAYAQFGRDMAEVFKRAGMM